MIPTIGGILSIILLLSKRSLAIDRRIFSFISPGLISSGIGEIIWDYYEFVLKIEPEEPFASTPFYYIFYITSIIALISINSTIHKKLYDKRDIIVLAIAYLVLPIALIVLVFFIFVELGLKEYQSLITLGYFIFDIAILSLIVYPLYKFAGGEISKFYLFYAVGIFFIAIGDLIYWVFGSLYEIGSLPDYVWVIGDSLIYIALYQRWKDVYAY